VKKLPSGGQQWLLYNSNYGQFFRSAKPEEKRIVNTEVVINDDAAHFWPIYTKFKCMEGRMSVEIESQGFYNAQCQNLFPCICRIWLCIDGHFETGQFQSVWNKPNIHSKKLQRSLCYYILKSYSGNHLKFKNIELSASCHGKWICNMQPWNWGTLVWLFKNCKYFIYICAWKPRSDFCIRDYVRVFRQNYEPTKVTNV